MKRRRGKEKHGQEEEHDAEAFWKVYSYLELETSVVGLVKLYGSVPFAATASAWIHELHETPLI